MSQHSCRRKPLLTLQTVLFVLAVIPVHPGASWRKTDDPINARVLSVLRIPGVLPSSYERPENVALLGCSWEAQDEILGS
eukprot:365471-Chlamydomonas_euryale.AAC.13